MITINSGKPFGQRFPNPSANGDGTQSPGWCADCNEATKRVQEHHKRTDIVSTCKKHESWLKIYDSSNE